MQIYSRKSIGGKLCGKVFSKIDGTQMRKKNFLIEEKSFVKNLSKSEYFGYLN
jgi:hypothetical protein